MQGATLFFSDIHADIDALNTILGMAEAKEFTERFGNVGRYVNLGDVMERGYHPKECVERLAQVKCLESVIGNHDEAFLGALEVSGNNAKSDAAHERYRKEGSFQGFFRGMGKYYVDRKAGIYAVHGGPVDPCLITPDDPSPVEAWLYTQTWQRISGTNRPYFDSSGYHYTPAAAFDSLCNTFDGGFIIVCGHEHAEAAYMQKDGYVRDIYEGLEKRQLSIEGRQVTERVIPVDKNNSYLIRLGIAGPEAYSQYYGWNRCHFGVLWDDGNARTFSMLSFVR